MERGTRNEETRAKEYQRIKKTLSLVHLFLTPLLLAIWIFTPLSISTQEVVGTLAAGQWVQVAFFFALFSVFFFVADFPFAFYSGFIIEHRFQISNLSLKGWCLETVKRSALSFLFALLLIEGLCLLIRLRGNDWWLWAWAAYAGVSFMIGKLFPVFIVPLFYKYQPLAEGELKTRILALLSRFGLPAAHLFSINLSKTTKKANAAFMGLGKTKRVVLSDTLIENFTPAEVEQVVAHELGHFKHRDIWKQLGLGLVISLVCFYLGFQGLQKMIPLLGLESASDVAGLPLLMLIFLLVSYGSLPITNGFSRICEYAADRFALEACRDKEVFQSMMAKLGRLNLADPDPSPIYEFVFYSHPSIKKRIAAVQGWKP